MNNESKSEPQGSVDQPNAKRRRPRVKSHQSRGGAARRVGVLTRLRTQLPKAVRANAVPALNESRGLAGEKLSLVRGPLEKFFRTVAGTVFDLLRTIAVVLVALTKMIAGPLFAAAGVAGRALTATINFGIRELTPQRALGTVLALALVGLVGSQFADYRAVAVGVPDYAGIGAAAPPPLVNQQAPTSAHGAAIFVLAGLCALLLLVMLRTKRWQLGRLISVLGLVVIGVVLLVDISASRELDQATRDYSGASPELLGGFWAQLASGLTLLVAGATLAVRGLEQPHGNATRSRTRRSSQPIASTPEPDGAATA